MGSPWTEKHAVQAKAAFVRLAADALAEGRNGEARDILLTSSRDASSDSRGGFIALLALHCGARVDIERILRTVCARAEGREETEVVVFWRVRLPDGRALLPLMDLDDEPMRFDTLNAAREAAAADRPGGRARRVTLTRRRILKAKKEGG